MLKIFAKMYILLLVLAQNVFCFWRKLIQKDIADYADADDPQVLRLKNLLKTRWTTRGAAAEDLLSKTVELQELLKHLSNDKTIKPECQAKSRGLLK